MHVCRRFCNLEGSWSPILAFKVRYLQIPFRSSKPFSYEPQYLGVSPLFFTRLLDSCILACFVHISPVTDLSLFIFFHKKLIHTRPLVRLIVLTEDLGMTGMGHIWVCELPLSHRVFPILPFLKKFLLKYGWCALLYKLQVYNIVIHNFLRLYSIYSYKILAIFPMLYNISL